MAESVLEKAKNHFLSNRNELRSFHVDEWDADIYFKPLTLVEQDRIYQYVRKGSLESIAETLIVRALDKNGANLFTSVNKTELLNMVDPEVMNGIVVAMTEDADDFEELVGN